MPEVSSSSDSKMNAGRPSKSGMKSTNPSESGCHAVRGAAVKSLVSLGRYYVVAGCCVDWREMRLHGP